MPYEPANTPRVYVDYTTPVGNYTFTVRPAVDAAIAGVASALHALLSANVAIFGETTTFIGARASFQGVDVSNPLAWEPIAGTGTANAAQYLPAYISAIGRTLYGTRCRIWFYGITSQIGHPSDYRFEDGDNALVDAFREDIADFYSELNCVAVDQQAPVWKNYMNFGFSAYRQRVAR